DKKNPQFQKLRQRKLIVGEVSRVLRRAHRTVVGRFHHHPAQPFVMPFDIRLDHDVLVDADSTMDARDGEMVNVEIDRYPDRSSSIARGRIVEVLGFLGEPGVDIEIVIRKYHLPHRFPDEVLAEAERIPLEVNADETVNSVDMRERNT